jgi:hypothetical protein
MTHVWLTKRDASRLQAVAKRSGLACTLTPLGRNARVEADGDYLRSLGLEPGTAGVQRLGAEFEDVERGVWR